MKSLIHQLEYCLKEAREELAEFGSVETAITEDIAMLAQKLLALNAED